MKVKDAILAGREIGIEQSRTYATSAPGMSAAYQRDWDQRADYYSQLNLFKSSGQAPSRLAYSTMASNAYATVESTAAPSPYVFSSLSAQPPPQGFGPVGMGGSGGGIGSAGMGGYGEGIGPSNAQLFGFTASTLPNQTQNPSDNPFSAPQQSGDASSSDPF